MKKFLALSLSDVVFIMLINVKMWTIFGILTLMSRMNLLLSWVEHGKSLITRLFDTQMIFWKEFFLKKLNLKKNQQMTKKYAILNLPILSIGKELEGRIH